MNSLIYSSPQQILYGKFVSNTHPGFIHIVARQGKILRTELQTSEKGDFTKFCLVLCFVIAAHRDKAKVGT